MLRQLPNAITIGRLIAVPPLLWLLLEERYLAAWWLALVAGASDAVDGFLAKRFAWTSRLGGLLDPIADKLLLACGFVGLWWNGQVPLALLLLVLTRDLLIVGGALAWHRWIGPVSAEPSRLSKFNTLAQIVYVLWLLAALAAIADIARPPSAMVWLVAASTVLSGVHYVWVWGRRAARVRGSERA